MIKIEYQIEDKIKSPMFLRIEDQIEDRSRIWVWDQVDNSVGGLTWNAWSGALDGVWEQVSWGRDS